MKTKLKKFCATIVTVVLSVICAGCGDLSALKTKYIAELDAYYQEIEAMDLEYSTIFIQAELEKGKENINAMKKSATMSAEVNATKQRMQEFILSQEELEEIKQFENAQILYYLGETQNNRYQLFVFDIVSMLQWDGRKHIDSYEFVMPKREIVVFDGNGLYHLEYAYVEEIIDLEDVADIYEKYTVIFNQTPNVFCEL